MPVNTARKNAVFSLEIHLAQAVLKTNIFAKY